MGVGGGTLSSVLRSSSCQNSLLETSSDALRASDTGEYLCCSMLDADVQVDKHVRCCLRPSVQLTERSFVGVLIRFVVRQTVFGPG